MAAVVDDLLDLRKFQDKNFALASNSFNVSSCIEGVCKIFKSQADLKEVEISCSIEKFGYADDE